MGFPKTPTLDNPSQTTEGSDLMQVSFKASTPQLQCIINSLSYTCDERCVKTNNDVSLNIKGIRSSH